MQNTTAVPILSPVLAPGALRAEAELKAAEAAPRRFAVCAMDYDESDAVVLAWGQAFRNGRVTLVGDAVPVRDTFSAVRSALRVCRALGAPLHVAWVDPEPEG